MIGTVVHSEAHYSIAGFLRDRGTGEQPGHYHNYLQPIKPRHLSNRIPPGINVSDVHSQSLNTTHLHGVLPSAACGIDIDV